MSSVVLSAVLHISKPMLQGAVPITAPADAHTTIRDRSPPSSTVVVVMEEEASPMLLLLPSPGQQRQAGHNDEEGGLFLPAEVLLNHVVGFLRPKDAAALMSTSQTLRRLDPHAHVRCIKGKFRSSSLLLANLHLCRRLATLDLRGNRLTSDGIRTLGDFLAGAAPSASSLEALDLSALSLTSLGIRLLAQSLAGRRDGGAADETQQQQQQQRPLRRLPLRSLALAVNNAGDDGAAAIGDLFASGALPRLEDANVSNSVITFQGLAHLARGLQGCPQLRRLNLSNNPLFEIPGAMFPFGVAAASEAALAAWDAFACALPSTLESLSIFNALLSAIAIHRLVLHWHAPALLSLNLSWNRIGADGASALARSLAKGACPSLRSLNLSHCVVDRAALADLTQALSAPGGIRHSIQHLNLGWNPLNAAYDAEATHPPAPAQQQQPPLRALAFALARCPNLDTLTLSNVELGDEGAAALIQGFLDAAAAAAAAMSESSDAFLPSAAGGCLPKLTQLNLSWNGVGSLGARAIAGLFTSPNGTCAPGLQILDISYNAAGTQGLRAMADAWADPSSATLPPQLIVHVIGNQVPRCAHHQVPAAQLGKLLDDIDHAASVAASAAAAAVAAMAAFAARHHQEQQQQSQEHGAQTDMVVSCSPPDATAAAMMDQGTQTPEPLEQQEQQQHVSPPPPPAPVIPIMAPLPSTPEHPRPGGPRGTTGPSSSSSSSSSAVAAAAAAGSLRRSARVRRTATATITAPYIPPSSSEGYYLATRNRRRRLCRR